MNENNMSDEALLTAYALGELDGAENAGERARVEALIASDAGAREEIERIREVGDELERELQLEASGGPATSLSAEQRRAIESELKPPVRRLRPWLLAAAGFAAVAVLVWELRTVAPTSTTATAPTGPVAMGEKERLPSDSRAKSPTGDAGASTPAPSAPVALAPVGAHNLGQLDAADGKLKDMDTQRTALQEKAAQADKLAAENAVLTAKVADLQKQGAVSTVDGSVILREPASSPVPAASSGHEVAQSSHLTGSSQSEPAAAEAELVDQLMSLGYVEGGKTAGRAVRMGGAGHAGAIAVPASDAPAADPVGPAGASDNDDRQDFGLCYWRVQPTPGTEYYAPIVEQGFASPIREPLSTFSIDVDTASYANVRRFLNNGQLPPADAVRIEELINYFDYDYAGPDGETPFATRVAVADCPWAAQHRLVRIGIKGREVPAAERAPSNLVFLLDVSGSMNQPDKLPLLVASLKLLTGQLDQRDRVAIVTYAGNAGLQLASTTCDGPGRQKVIDTLDSLGAGGSTAGAAGISLAYQIATGSFIPGGTNRVILATDGDFNVGITDKESLQRLIETSAQSGVFLSVLGFGEGNLKDGTAELLADKGNGNYSYIDSLDEGQRVLVKEMGGTLVTIAKDVKIQVEFNPAKVGAYRLIGYENRALAAADFNNDKKDAGEIGAGHTVTALYEVVPVGVALVPGVDELKYQTPPAAAVASGAASGAAAGLAAPQFTDSPDLLTLKLRWKAPDSDTSTKLEWAVQDGGGTLAQAGPDASFSAAVAAFGMLLRGSGSAGDASWDSVIALAEAGRGADADGYRAEFIRLAKVAKGLSAR